MSSERIYAIDDKLAFIYDCNSFIIKRAWFQGEHIEMLDIYSHSILHDKYHQVQKLLHQKKGD